MNWGIKGQSIRAAGISGVCGLVLCAQSSCSLFSPQPQAEREQPKILNSIGVNQNMIAVDFYRIRIRYEQRQFLEDFWNDDRTSDLVVPVDLRRRLAEEGIRIGVQGSSLSPTLSRLLELDKIQLAEATGQMAERTTTRQQTVVSEISSDEMLLEPLVDYQLLSLSSLPGKRWIVNTYNDVLPQAFLFWEQGGWCGQTYPKAQGTIDLSAISYPDEAGIRFDLLPILEYGDPRHTSRLSSGGYIPDFGREQLIYDRLKMSIKLLPGQWLVIGPTSPNPPGIGKPFFTRDKGRPEQQILIFRLK